MRIPTFCLALLSVAAPLVAAEPSFDAFVESIAADYMRADPNAATTQQYFSGAEQDALDRRLTVKNKASRAADVALAQRGLDGLKAYDRHTLTSTQRVSAAMMEWQLREIIAAAPFEDYAFPFQQFRGRQVEVVNFLSQTHPIRNRRDIENYLARLDLVAGVIDDALAQAKETDAKGILPPKFILTATIDQMGRFLADAPEKNVLVTSLDERAAKLKDFPAADRAKAVAAAAQTVRDAIIPAFRRAQAFLQSQLPRATDDAGLWRLPGGDAAYANALRRNTTTDLTAEQIHELGLKEVARIEGQMDTLLRELGFTEGRVKERYEQLDATLQPKETDPRPMLLARYTEIVRDAEKRSALLFDLRPQAPCAVKREPPFTEKNAAAHYNGPARDGTRPGTFWVPLPDAPWPMARMRTLAYHEAVPGHHFQITLQVESKELPAFRRDRVFGGIPAHSEGWGLYAERLAAESGWYEGDKVGRVGQLNSELFRARRLVVDTGLHAKRWTRQQAIDYGIPVAEVERYVVNPGQACAYKIGELKILEVRDKAKRALGDRFDLKEFHNLVLRTGTVPLAVLEQVVDDFIASKS